MSKRKVLIIDYGMGNLWSVLNAFHYLGIDAILVNEPKKILEADFIVLPGVGSFRKAMITLKKLRFDEAIYEAVNIKHSKILGICLGMQLLGSYGSEDGETSGLGLINNRVDQFTLAELGINKIPHVGFNTVHFCQNTGLFKDIPDQADFYFIHSYRMLIDKFEGNYASCRYGVEFLAAFEMNNICGTQFHPEKSQTNGLILLKNFLEI